MTLEDLRNDKNIKLNNIYNCDCIEGMKFIPDNTVDCILCDLPYQMTKNSWDISIPLNILWDEYKRIIKTDGTIILFGNQPFSSHLVLSNLEMFKYSLVWEKNKFSDFMNAKKKPLKIHEDILIFYGNTHKYNPQYTIDKPYTKWNTQNAVDENTNYNQYNSSVSSSNGKRYPTTVLKFNRVPYPVHPTQKPTDLLEWLILSYTNIGDVILDNCIGSGSTGVAAINTKRNIIGFETSEEYYNIAVKRIKEAMNKLF